MSASLISIFHRTSCNSGFISHLYQHELRHLYSSPPELLPDTYRLSPTSYLELPTGDTPDTTLWQSVKTKLDNLVTTISYSQTHYVLCVKNNSEVFNTQLVTTQCRALSILETCHALAESIMTHTLRIPVFCTKYWVITRDRRDTDMVTRCTRVVDTVKNSLDNKMMSSFNNCNVEWVVGTTHVCFSEGARQVMERMRKKEREKAAKMIQRWWGRIRKSNNLSCDVDTILQTISLHGLDKVIITF